MKETSVTSRRDAIKKLATLPFLGASLDNLLISAAAHSARRTASLIPVMITPFLEDKSIDWKSFDRLTEFYNAAGADGYFANCLSSEMYFLEPEERLAITERVIKRFNGKKQVVSTGSFGDTIEEKAEFVKKIHHLGTDAVILITSHFAGKQDSDEVLIENLRKLTQLTGQIPLGTYESPTPYKRVLSPQVFEYLVESKRFTYHKDTSENLGNISDKLGVAKSSALQLFNAHTASAAASIRAGAAGLSPISANFYPEILNWLCDNARNPKKKEEVDWIQSEISETEPLISRGYPVSSKYFLQKRGMPIGLVARAPRNPLTGEQKTVLDNVYNRFLGWCERLEIKPAAVS